MTKEEEKYYENRLSMFASQGWKDLVEDVRIMEAATNTLNAVIPENLLFKKGEVSMMQWFLNIEEISKQAYAQLSIPMREGPYLPEDEDLPEPSDAG